MCLDTPESGLMMSDPTHQGHGFTGGNGLDASRFDRWSRAMTTGSRRSMLGGVVMATLALTVSPLINLRAVAQRSAPDAVAFCRMLDEIGELDPSFTQGECVAAHKDRSSPQAKSHFAGYCGQPLVQQMLGVRNKGECIEVVKRMEE